VTGGKPIAVLLQSILDVSAINPLVAFYDILGGKREVLFCYFVTDTTRDLIKIAINKRWSKVSLGLKMMLSLLFAKKIKMTVTASVLNQE
jgi:hypothetical protein